MSIPANNYFLLSIYIIPIANKILISELRVITEQFYNTTQLPLFRTTRRVYFPLHFGIRLISLQKINVSVYECLFLIMMHNGVEVCSACRRNLLKADAFSLVFGR